MLLLYSCCCCSSMSVGIIKRPSSTVSISYTTSSIEASRCKLKSDIQCINMLIAMYLLSAEFLFLALMRKVHIAHAHSRFHLGKQLTDGRVTVCICCFFSLFFQFMVRLCISRWCSSSLSLHVPLSFFRSVSACECE